MNLRHQPPAIVIAAAVSAVGVVALFLWLLTQAVVPVAEALAIIIKAFGVAGGLAVATAGTGLATAGSVAPWLAQAATAGIGVVAVSTSYLVIARIVEKGKDQPYDWLLPAFGLLAVFCVDLTKDPLIASVTERALYGLVTGLLTIGGGILLMQARLAVRAIGGLLPFIPPALLCGDLMRKGQLAPGLADLNQAGTVGLIGIYGVFVLALIIVLLGILLPRKPA